MIYLALYAALCLALYLSVVWLIITFFRIIPKED